MAGTAESRWRRLQHLLLEGFVIVFSVLFALFVEDLRSESQARSEVSAALAALDLEVQGNLDELETFAAVVAERHDRLVALAPTVDGSRPFSEYRFGGYPTADLELSAWARVSADPVANRMAPERVREAFLLYNYLEFLLKLDDQIRRLVFSPGFHDPAEAVLTYRVSEAILDEQIQYAQIMVSQHRAHLETQP